MNSAATRSLAFGAVWAAVALLSSCSGTFTSDAPVSHAYVLRAATATATASATATGAATGAATATTSAASDGTPASLRVSRPAASPGLETDRILLARPDRQLDFFANGHWAGAVPDIVGSLAIETLRAAPGAGTVYGEGTPFPSDYVLHMVVRNFEAHYLNADGAPSVQVTLDCTVGRRLDRTVIATFVAESTVPAEANRLTEVVAAFERASHGALAVVNERVQAALASDRAAFAAQNVESPVASMKR